MATRSESLEAVPAKVVYQVSPKWFAFSSTAIWLVALAFTVRIAFMLGAHAYLFDRYRIDDYSYLNETTSISRSIAEGHGFSSPFSVQYTGPTAWIAPVYPYLCALVFLCFGVLTTKAAVTLLILQSVFSALTCIPILGIAERTVGRGAGLAAALLWAVFPWFSKWAVSWVWELSLSTLLFACLFWYALRLAEPAARRWWIGFGALWGFALLVNPALLPLFPASLVWCVYQRSKRVACICNFFADLAPTLKSALLSLVVCALVISPWLIRNRVVFGEWVFLRSNFGFEFHLGNNRFATGRGWIGQHPAGNPAELARYERMGEPAYARSRMSDALHWIFASPSDFLKLTARRVIYFWDGSAMGYRPPMAWYWVPPSFAVLSFLAMPAMFVAHRRRLHAWPLFFAAILLYPLPYYLTFSQVRYRAVLEPLLLLLLCYAVSIIRVDRQG